ncbi:sucrose synthase 2 [Prunus yedoensis var. nudiflora]|uniref:Sucrose synthase 2 n=1 Tax=Prunus yedoensis var. nudiflora TaxID=2094558 RepID=A0A315AJD4_PRUYE|nr:sucrose synthase 2 [Prunus yedoensis var. nudiflora]
MFRNKDSLEPLLDFLRAHKCKGHALMLNDRIQSISSFSQFWGRLRNIFLSFHPRHPILSLNMYYKEWVSSEDGEIMQYMYWR